MFRKVEGYHEKIVIYDGTYHSWNASASMQTEKIMKFGPSVSRPRNQSDF